VLANKIAFIEELANSGLADALDVTDGSRGIPLMPPGDFITAARDALGWTPRSGVALEFIPHFTTRDLNTMGLQSRLMGYFWQRIHNVILITGDPPKMSPTYPRSSAVFDVDSVGMVNFVHGCLNAGVDFGGRRLGRHANPRTHFTIGTGFEPEALDLPHELEKLENKIGGGADYVMTQPAFRNEPLAVLDPYRNRIPVLIGVMILTGLEHARRVGQVPGVTIPDTIYARLAAFDRPDDQARVGRDIAFEQIRWIKANGWPGLYLMSPSSHRPILEVLGGA
jgi:homocysteine S-methyltransferase